MLTQKKVTKLRGNTLDVWVLVCCDYVAVFQPDNIWQRVSNGFDGKFDQGSLFHADVSQLLCELWPHQGFFS